MRKPDTLDPLEKAASTKRISLLDQKNLLEDRGGILPSDFKRSVFEKYKISSSIGDKRVTFSERNTFKFSENTRGLFIRIKTLLVVLLVAIFVETRLHVAAKGAEPRYETAYACEGKTLKIGCAEGSVIHLIRANYGRFSITICNDHGNTDWSVNCMSTRSLRVLHSRCSMHQNCSILASTSMFGDPCPNTLKYLEAHYQCVPASTTSTTSRPSPPWLITSQPTVWRSTAAPVPKSPAQSQQEKKKPTVITPPTFRPHITLPPEVQLGNIGTKKTTTRQPELSPEKEIQSALDKISVIQEEIIKSVDTYAPKGDKAKKEKEEEPAPVTDETLQWAPKDEIDPTQGAKDRPSPEEDDFEKSYTTSATPALGRRAYCPQINARGLHWNWTLAGTYAVQPCPGGATGLARWKCTLTPNQHIEEERPRRRGAGLQSGENFHDLGLDQPSERQMQLIRRLGSEGLLKGREGDSLEHLIDYRGTAVLLPDAQASLHISTDDLLYADAIPEWHGPTPDLSECRSVWLNSLEARVREGESLLSISNDLAQVTSSKTLYGGDMMTTTNIMKKLAQRMSDNVRTFPDPRQKEAIVTDMLLGVIKTGSNLLEESQRASWSDLSTEAQNRAATSLLTQLEENAFLLADAVTKEKTILQIVKNICLSVRVLEVKNVEDETFPSVIAQEQWKASEDTITIPKAALLENHQIDLVRIVFFAFDRLEEILPPTFGKTPQFAAYSSEPVTSSTSLNSEKEKKNVTRVLNSKVISASLGNGKHIELSQMVRLTMKHLKTENVTNPTCVFWDYTLHGWSSEGCQVEWSNLTHTGCACSHLTNFAILMDVRGIALGAKHELALRLLTLIGCAISSIALLAAILVFQCFRNMKSDRVLIHKNLCACLLIAEVVFMCGIDQTQDRILCGIIAGLLHYFFLAAFAWMFLEGFHLYAMLVEVFEPERARARWYVAGAYAAPAVVVLGAAAAYPQGYGTDKHCWLSTDRMFMMSFVGPVAIVLVANWICLSMVIYMMCHHSTVSIKAKENSKIYKIRVWLNSSVVLAFLLGLTWTFGLLYLNEQTVGVAYTFTILNSLQGLFIFIFHCLQNEIFQKECARLGRRHRWLSCCLFLAPAPTSSNHVDTRGSTKSRRYAAAEPEEDHRDVTNTSSKHHTSTLPHHDTLSRQMAQNHLQNPYPECEAHGTHGHVPGHASSHAGHAPGSPRHRDEDHQGYQTTRSYNPDFRNPHVFMSHSPGSQEMIFRKYKDERRKHHHGSNHYSEIASQGRIYRRGSEEFRIQDDPVYEEIERNETLVSDMSDDSVGRPNPPGSAKFFGDHRPLISYSPGERLEDYGKYGRWDTIERSYDGRYDGRYPPPENMRALAAVLNAENNVVCHLEPPNSYDTYPQPGRTVSQPSF
ncbi:latrophilin Cirl isoform X2 [Aricia agestis]|uniref:latrophilin Cirl isoform X2 n=1 Tax=Aricia agestis TaxID=91739 RepID=UPI001C2029A3|nr:latrophilin Cirl isoform X2 [Aricia agestis]